MTTPQPTDPVEALGLSTRVRNALLRNGIHTLGDLTACSPTDLRDIRNLGVKGYAEVLAALDQRGLELTSEPASPR